MLWLSWVEKGGGGRKGKERSCIFVWPYISFVHRCLQHLFSLSDRCICFKRSSEFLRGLGAAFRRDWPSAGVTASSFHGEMNSCIPSYGLRLMYRLLLHLGPRAVLFCHVRHYLACRWQIFFVGYVPERPWSMETLNDRTYIYIWYNEIWWYTLHKAFVYGALQGPRCFRTPYSKWGNVLGAQPSYYHPEQLMVRLLLYASEARD